jgi:hypothetical protein
MQGDCSLFSSKNSGRTSNGSSAARRRLVAAVKMSNGSNRMTRNLISNKTGHLMKQPQPSFHEPTINQWEAFNRRHKWMTTGENKPFRSVVGK